MRATLVPFLALALALSAAASPPALEIPAEVKPVRGQVRLTPKTDAVSVVYVGLSGIDPFPSEELKDQRRFILDCKYLPAGRYEFVAVAASKTGEQARADFTVVVGTQPVPPGPGPDPKPPTPPPPPADPNPFGAMPGLRVLIVFETADATKLPRGQQAIMYGGTTRAYLDSHCATGPDGKTKEYRIFDKDVDASGEAATWTTAMKTPRSALPWVYIGKEATGYSGPLPADPDAFLTLVQKYGGK